MHMHRVAAPIHMYSVAVLSDLCAWQVLLLLAKRATCVSRSRSVRYKGFSGNLAFRAPRYTSVLALSISAADDFYASDGFLSDDDLSDGWDKPRTALWPQAVKLLQVTLIMTCD